MQHVSTLFDQQPSKQALPNIRSERDELIQMFTDRLNLSRKQAGYKAYPVRAVAVKLSHLSVRDMRDFYKDCERANSFGAYFHWALKPEKRD